MSVINKMLRDLDTRRASGASPPQSGESRTGVTRDTVSVKDARLAAAGGRRWGAWFLMGGMVLGLGWAVGWYLDGRTVTGKLERRAATAPVALPAPVPAAAPVPAPMVVAGSGVLPTTPAMNAGPATAPAVAKEASVPPVVAASSAVDAGPLRSVASPMAKPLPKPDVDNTVKAVPKTTEPSGTMKPQPPAEHVPVSRTAPAASKSFAPVQAPSLTAQRQAAARETLVQAQNLWTSGSREAALELMRDAVAVAERASSSGDAADGVLLLTPLVKELARMELAEGRVSQVLDMLTRLEPVLSNQADLWAVRGNAAQRLGRHQDSVNAYLRALKLRPNEPRWMLGAAVSLAAQGQTAAAAELAEKARAGGVVSPEVSVYLRQLGVPLHDR